MMRVPGAATRSAARPIAAVIDAVVLGLTTRISIDPLSAAAGLASAERPEQEQRDDDDGERDRRRHRARRVDLGVGDGGGEAGQLERQRVLVAAERLARP